MGRCCVRNNSPRSGVVVTGASDCEIGSCDNRVVFGAKRKLVERDEPVSERFLIMNRAIIVRRGTG